MIDDALAKNIAGEITLSDNPANTLRKWRHIFGVNQKTLAKKIQVSPSVVSDYESGRRKNPGSSYVKKTVEALIKYNTSSRGEFKKQSETQKQSPAILDIREFLDSVPVEKLIKKIHGRVISGKPQGTLSGYTVVDSIQAILSLSDTQFERIYGPTTERALVFTKVGTGRSPMIALKVTQPKPAVAILHGLTPSKVDKLAVKIAEVSKIPLVVSKVKGEEKLIKNLRELNS